MKFMWRYAKNYRKEIIISIIGSIAFAAVMVGMPMIVGNLIDYGLAGADTAVLKKSLGQLISLVLISFILRSLERVGVSTLSSGITRDIRNDVYSKIMKLSPAEFEEFGVASLTTRITTDAFMILQFSQMFFGLGLGTIIVSISSIVMVARTSVKLGLRVLPTIVIIFFIIMYVVKKTVSLSTKQQETLDDINRSQRESIIGMRAIRGFNRQDFFAERFSKINRTYSGISKELNRLTAIPSASSWIIIDFALSIVVWLGAGYLGVGELQLGDLVSFIQYVTEALFSIVLFSNILMFYPRAQVSADRLQAVLDAEISVKNAENPVTKTSGKGHLEFKNVTFTYPDASEPVLSNISFEVKPGQTLAFIGSTGSGKSTIVKLIPRFYDVTEGEILLDGINIKDIDLKVLRDKIGYTPQKSNLFTGAISDNIKIGKMDAVFPEMKKASDVAQASEFIEKTEDGYETLLAEGGSNLSGGQKQRLTIARSVIRDSDVLIFDDSFSALDNKTDAAVRKALKEDTKDAATIIVAQRVGSIMNADEIIVLDRGKIAARGTHDELLKSSKLYYEIASSQLSEEELACVK